jgi:hypothetical protein
MCLNLYYFRKKRRESFHLEVVLQRKMYKYWIPKLLRYDFVCVCGEGVMVFIAIFNNISVISWWSVVLMKETGVTRENH